MGNVLVYRVAVVVVVAVVAGAAVGPGAGQTADQEQRILCLKEHKVLLCWTAITQTRVLL